MPAREAVALTRKPPPPLDDAEIERRMPLWEALADLYLDTESDSFVPHILEIARVGSFTLAEIDHILRWEVRPALFTNYLSVAGEWAGWDRDWLREHIVKTMAKPPSVLIGKNRLMPEEWPKIQAAMAD